MSKNLWCPRDHKNSNHASDAVMPLRITRHIFSWLCSDILLFHHCHMTNKRGWTAGQPFPAVRIQWVVCAPITVLLTSTTRCVNSSCFDQQDDFPVMQVVCVVCTSNSYIDSKAPKLDLTYVDGAKTFGKLVFLNGKQVAASLEQCTEYNKVSGRTASPPPFDVFPCVAAAAKDSKEGSFFPHVGLLLRNVYVHSNSLSHQL